MKALVSTLVALAVMAAFVAPVTAEARIKKHRYAKHQPGHQAQRYSGYRSVEKYEEFIADKRPVGTSSWWNQMDREGRGGRR